MVGVQQVVHAGFGIKVASEVGLRIVVGSFEPSAGRHLKGLDVQVCSNFVLSRSGVLEDLMP